MYHTVHMCEQIDAGQKGTFLTISFITPTQIDAD